MNPPEAELDVLVFASLNVHKLIVCVIWLTRLKITFMSVSPCLSWTDIGRRSHQWDVHRLQTERWALPGGAAAVHWRSAGGRPGNVAPEISTAGPVARQHVSH